MPWRRPGQIGRRTVHYRTVLAVLAGMAAVLTISIPATAFAGPATATTGAGRVVAAAQAERAKPAATAAAGEQLYAFNTGLVLSVVAHPAKGAAVRVEASSGTAGQRWIFGAHQTLRPAANQALCLNVPDGKYRSGVKLQLWRCDGHASERFGRSAPSAHTAVRYLRLVQGTGYCVTSLADEVGIVVARVELARCAALTTQAWSTTDLQFAAGYLSDAWAVQAQHPTTAGSDVTGSRAFTSKLDQAWISSYTGATNDSPVVLKPVLDTALCAELAGAEEDGTTLKLARCTGSADQQFMGIGLIFNANYTWSYLTTTDSLFCVQAAPAGSATIRAVVLGPCVGNNRDTWMATMDLTTGMSGQYQELYAGTGSTGLDYSMDVSGTSAGSKVVLAKDEQAAAQIWTDLPPGQAKVTGNPDGSITLRPLSDESLCLTVPGGDYAAGVQLTVQACDGAVDQEFVRGLADSPTDLIAAGGGEFCVAAPSGISAAGAVDLEPCAQQADQEWMTFLSWYGWAGVSPAASYPVAAPAGDVLVLSGITAGGGQVGVEPSPGLSDWNTTQDWIQVEVSGGFEIQSFYDRGLCLDVPATTAGTQLTAAPCAGGSAQTFLYGPTDSRVGNLWVLEATDRSTEMCVALGPTAGAAGLPLELEACSAGDADEAWQGPTSL